MANTPENRVKIKLRKLLKQRRLVWSTSTTHGFGSSGMPDYIVCAYGFFLGVECKTPGKEATELQKKKMRDIGDSGGLSMVYDGSPTAHAYLITLLDRLQIIGKLTQRQERASAEMTQGEVVKFCTIQDAEVAAQNKE